MPSAPRRALQAAFAVYLGAVAWVTLRPDLAPDEAFDAVREAARWLSDHGVPVTFELVEAVANVVMFVPFGVLLGLLLARRWPVVPLACLTSAAVETSQALFLPSRVATVQDVAMNTLGAAVGLAGLVLAERVRLARAAEPVPADLVG